MPPASRSAAKPSAGAGSPAARWTSAARGDADRGEPDGDAGVGLLRARGGAAAGSRARAGRAGPTTPTRPNVPATTAWTTSPAVPASPHHSRAATTTASARSVKPMPSRRCAGSRSRAPCPMRRAVPPTTCAQPIHTPAHHPHREGGPARRRDGGRAAPGRARGAAASRRAPGRGVRVRVAWADRPEEDVRVAMVPERTRRSAARRLDTPRHPGVPVTLRRRRSPSRPARPGRVRAAGPGAFTGQPASRPTPRVTTAAASTTAPAHEQADPAAGPGASGAHRGEEEPGRHEDRGDAARRSARASATPRSATSPRRAAGTPAQGHQHARRARARPGRSAAGGRWSRPRR